MKTLITISYLLVAMTLLTNLHSSLGNPECNPGYYYSGVDCGTPTKGPAHPGTTWSIEADTVEKVVYLRKVGDNTAGVYKGSYTSASDTYYVFTHYNGGTIEFDRSVGFYQNQYNPSTVTFGSQTITIINDGGVYSKSVAVSGVTKFRMTFTSVDDWICFGIVETTTFDTASSGFSDDKQGVCASTSGTTSWNILLICPGCSECHQSCEECSGGSNTDCTACSSGYYLQPNSACLTTCPTGYWKDTANRVCSVCHASCSQCTGSLNTQCSACKSSYFLQPSPISTTCLSTCPIFYAADTTNNNCVQCHTYCSQCTGSSNTQCSACKSGYFLQPSSTTCLNSCPASYFKDTENNVCVQCHAACSQCSDSSNTQCTACKSDYFLQPSSTTCLSSCPAGYYQDSTNHACPPCDTSCSQCTGSLNTQCSACNSGYFLQPSSTTCLDSCPSTGYFKDTTNHVCLPCDHSCLTCTGPSFSDCPSCATGYYLQPSSTSCMATCPDGYYQNSTFNTCPACDPTCKTCSSYTNTSCLTCYPTAYFYQNQCFTECPSHTFPVESNMTCADCSVSCAECNGSTNYDCTACTAGLFLFNSTCQYICPQGTFANAITSTCDACDQTCKTCSGPTASSCISCDNGSATPYFYQFSCSQQCPNGTYPDTQAYTCRNCHLSCATCTGPLNTSCASCKGTLYYNSDQRVCVSSCTSPYSAVAATRTCEIAQLADASTLSQTLQSLIDQMLASPLSSSSNATTLQDSGSFLNNLANTVSDYQTSNFVATDLSQQQQQCLDSCNNNGDCQYQSLYLEYQCQCSSGWTGPSCATSTSDQSAIEAISLKIINAMSSVPLSLTMASTWSESYLQSLLVLSNSSFSTISVTKQALSVIKNVVNDDFNAKTESDVFDPVKMTIAAQILDNCLQYVFKTDCYLQKSESQMIYNDIVQILEKLGVLNLWQKLPDSGNYSLYTTDFELYSERISPQELLSHTIAQPNQAKIVLQSGGSTSTASTTTPVDIQILFWKNNLMACPSVQKENNQPPLVSMAINEKDSTTQSPHSSTVSAQIAYPALPNQKYTNCSSSSCTIAMTKDSNGATFYQCNCPNLNSMSVSKQAQQALLFSNFFKLANAAALLSFDFLSSWVFWILWAQAVWFLLTAVAIRARIIRPFIFRARGKESKLPAKSEKGSSLPSNLRNFNLKMGLWKSIFYGLKYGHVFTSLYLYEDGAFPRFKRLVLLYARILSLMAFSSLFKNTDNNNTNEEGNTENNEGIANFQQTMMILFLPVITVTPVNLILKILLITKIKSQKFIDHVTRKNPKLREEELKKKIKSKKIAKIKEIIGYILIVCAVLGCNYITIVIAASTNKEQTTKWAISFLISLVQDMGTVQVMKVIVTVFLVRFIAKGQSKKVVKIIRFGIDPIVVRALAMASLQK